MNTCQEISWFIVYTDFKYVSVHTKIILKYIACVCIKHIAPIAHWLVCVYINAHDDETRVVEVL